MIEYYYDADGNLEDFTVDDDWGDLDEVPEWVDERSPVRWLEETS